MRYNKVLTIVSAAVFLMLTSPPPKSLGLDNLEVGAFLATAFMVSGEQLSEDPRTATLRQEYIQNDLDGLGFGPTIQLGGTARVPLFAKSSALAMLSYSYWSSTTPLVLENPLIPDEFTEIGSNESTLGYLQLALGFQHPFLHYTVNALGRNYDVHVYAGVDIQANLFFASATEEDDIRGSFEYSDTFLRAGLGLSAGAEVDIRWLARTSFRYLRPGQRQLLSAPAARRKRSG